MEQTNVDETNREKGGGGSFPLSPSNIGLGVDGKIQNAAKETRSTTRSGEEKINLNFGRISGALTARRRDKKSEATD